MVMAASPILPLWIHQSIAEQAAQSSYSLMLVVRQCVSDGCYFAEDLLMSLCFGVSANAHFSTDSPIIVPKSVG